MQTIARQAGCLAVRKVGLMLPPLLAAGALLLPVTASATESTAVESESAAQVTASNAVETKSAELGVAQNEAQAVQDQKALALVVKAAVKAGDGTKLLETTKDGSVVVDVVKDLGGTNVKKDKADSAKHKKPKLHRNGTEDKEITAREMKAEAAHFSSFRANKPSSKPGRTIAHSAACWGEAWTILEWDIAPGATVAWLYANAGWWCGNGYEMTGLGGPTLTTWSWGPFCIGNQYQNWSWDVYNSWVHTGQWGSIGASYPWGCFTWEGGHATVRIAANGYWDTYDDFGF